MRDDKFYLSFRLSNFPFSSRLTLFVLVLLLFMTKRSGDVKYHLGTSYRRTYPDGRKVTLELLPNPSHLEAVNPLVVGKARAKVHVTMTLKDFILAFGTPCTYSPVFSPCTHNPCNFVYSRSLSLALSLCFPLLQMDLMGDEVGHKVLPIIIHGDAAFAGQGIVYETMQMAKLEAYQTGGSINVICNNQIGFTATPQQGRSTR